MKTPSRSVSRVPFLVRLGASALLVGVVASCAADKPTATEATKAVATPAATEAARPAAPAVLRTDPAARIMNEATYGAYVFGGMPEAGDLQAYKDAGVTRVVTLRTPAEPEGYDEAAACAALGLEFVRLPFDPSAGDEAAIDAILAEFRKGPGDGTLVHCGSGNRVAILFAVHRVLDEGVDLETALADAKAVGMKGGPPEALVRAAVASRSAAQDG